MLWCSFGKKQAAQPALSKCTGFAIIIAVNTMSPHQPEFKEEDKEHIEDEPDQPELIQDDGAREIHGE
jgi:hypothetical protein